MVTGSRFLITLIFALIALMSVSLAQDSEEACSSRETVYPLVKTAILAEASYKVAHIRHAASGEQLEIIGSKRFGPWCWLQVSDGWVIDNARSLSSEPLSGTPFQQVIIYPTNTPTPPSCYEADKAYIVGSMNIRAGASTNSSVVASALAGDVFTVSNSTMGANWCWLRIRDLWYNFDLGWMAETSHVRSTDPTQPVDAGSAAPSTNIDNCCFVDRICTSQQELSDGYSAYQRNECPGPPHQGASGGHAIGIEGSSEFNKLMSETLDLLQSSSQKWHHYVASAVDRIIEDENNYTMSALSAARTVKAAPYRRLIRLGSDTIRRDQAVLRSATGLVHEACHIHRYEAGFVYGPYTKITEELACIQAERNMMRVVSPDYPVWIVSVIGPSHCNGSLENYWLCAQMAGKF